MNTGWICPKCQTSNAPTQPVCGNCRPAAAFDPMNPFRNLAGWTDFAGTTADYVNAMLENNERTLRAMTDLCTASATSAINLNGRLSDSGDWTESKL